VFRPPAARVPLTTVAHIVTQTEPESINHLQQLNSATIQGVAVAGVTVRTAVDYLDKPAALTLPEVYSVDYAGQLRQLKQESSGFAMTFAFALIIVFLSLAALFESFRDPLIILVSVPMSIAGALFFVAMVPGASPNIFTEFGLVTLMGLISKHGILIMEVANNLQPEGLAKREAIEKAAGIRLQPILMTTAAMMLGVVPLPTATGAGANSRFVMGLVIATGRSIALCNRARVALMHLSYPGQMATAGNIASPFTPLEIPLGQVCAFNVYHLMQVDDPAALFPINIFEV
jgi:multidrug efflux pump